MSTPGNGTGELEFADAAEPHQSKAALEEAISTTLRSMLAKLPTLVWRSSADGSGNFFNERWYDYTGISFEDAQGDGWTEAFHPDERDALLALWMEIVASRKSSEVEARFRRHDGEYRWHLMRSEPLFDDQGKLIAWCGTNTDIHDLKQAEEEIRSKVFLEHAQTLSRTGSIGLRIADGKFTWSDEAARIFGYDPTTRPTVERMLQRTHPDDRSLLEETFARASKGNASFDFEFRLLLPTAAIKHLRYFAHSAKNEAGEEEVLGVVIDITEQTASRATLEDALARAKKSEAEFRAIIEAIPTLAWRTRADGHAEFFSQRWHDYTGLSFEDAQGEGWSVAVHPGDFGALSARWREAIASKKSDEFEARFRRYDGEYRWHLFRAAPHFDDEGTLTNWFGTTTDIDDLKRAEMILAGEKKLFEMIATGQPLPAILDAFCRNVEELSEDSVASILLLDEDGKRVRHGAAPSLPESYTKAIDGGLIGPSAGSCGTAIYRGEKVYVSDIATHPLWADFKELALSQGLRACFSTPIFSSDGKVLGTFGIYARKSRDITSRESRITEQFTHLASIIIERKRAENALRDSEASLAEGQRISHTGSWRWNADTDQVVWSEECARLYGFSPEERVVTPAAMLERVLPEDIPLFSSIEAQARRGDGKFEFEHRIVLPDGSLRLVQSIGRPVPADPGTGIEYVGTVRDITEQRNREVELRRSAADLQKAQVELAHVTRVTTMGELAASIAHEVNQPIAGVVLNGNACLRWLAREQTDSPNIVEAREAIQRIIRDGSRAGEVITRIRALFKKADTMKEPLEINEIIREVIVLARSEIEKRHVTLLLDLTPDLPQVLGDRVQLQQVLLNLILNGIDAIGTASDHSRELLITTGTHGKSDVLISVRDTGVGIDPLDAEAIFTAFHTTKPGGLGMGLPISRSIVEAHGGKLWASSNDGPGSSFNFTLPIPSSAG